MILFDLKCRRGHVFEAWFRDSASFKAQHDGGEIACPVCGATRVTKAPMAPRLSRGRASAKEDAPRLSGPAASPTGALYKKCAELHRQIEENCDYVGERFPEEARKMHYGEAKKRSIYGEASEEEARALVDEGVEVYILPWMQRAHRDS
jgi:hypothetical protein